MVLQALTIFHYKFWITSSSSEVNDVTTNYSSGDGKFVSLGTAIVGLGFNSTPPPTIDVSVSSLPDFGDVIIGLILIPKIIRYRVVN